MPAREAPPTYRTPACLAEELSQEALPVARGLVPLLARHGLAEARSESVSCARCRGVFPFGESYGPSEGWRLCLSCYRTALLARHGLAEVLLDDYEAARELWKLR